MADSNPLKLSILDLAPIVRGGTAREAIAASVALAQRAERHRFERVWYAEHHNMEAIASSATSVLIAHVGAQTSTIRLGAGGIMLPNHAPLVIAEQFGTLEAMYPGRIDLGLGRAPGSDQATMRALRRRPTAADEFPQDIKELQGYFADQTLIAGINAVPGRGADIPLYILGSSLFGAQLAAVLGLPYAFASHFAPQALLQALEVYRTTFTPSQQLDSPYVMAALNVMAADSEEEAEEMVQEARRTFTRRLVKPGQEIDDDTLDELIHRGAGAQYDQMFHYRAAGTQDTVSAYLREFQQLTGADELITAHQAPTLEARLRSVEITAAARDAA